MFVVLLKLLMWNCPHHVFSKLYCTVGCTHLLKYMTNIIAIATTEHSSLLRVRIKRNHFQHLLHQHSKLS